MTCIILESGGQYALIFTNDEQIWISTNSTYLISNEGEDLLFADFH